MPFLSISRQPRKSSVKPIQEVPVQKKITPEPPVKLEEKFTEITSEITPEIIPEVTIPEITTSPDEVVTLIVTPEIITQEIPPSIAEAIAEIQPEKSESEKITESQSEQSQEIQETQKNQEKEEFKLKYDFTSGERYVDLISTKTEFDKMLGELENMSKDFLSWEADKFMKKFLNKFKSDENNTEAQATAKKFEAFLGGFINEAAIMLYDKGYGDLAIKRLDQAKSILETKKRLEEETLAINTRVEESGDMVDLSDILSLLGDG